MYVSYSTHSLCLFATYANNRPYIISFWAVLDFIFLYGNFSFPRHWLFWQNKLDLFNEANPVVGITDSIFYMRILIAMIVIGISASLKRLFTAIYLGRRAVAHFGPELEKLMAKMILIGEVANLARDIENKRSLFEGAGLSPNTDKDEGEKLVKLREYVRDEYSSAEESPSPRVATRKTLEVSPHSPAETPSPIRMQRMVLNPPNSNNSNSKKSPATPADSVGQSASPGRRRSTAGSGSAGGHSPPRPLPPRSGSDPSPGSDTAHTKNVAASSTANVQLSEHFSSFFVE